MVRKNLAILLVALILILVGCQSHSSDSNTNSSTKSNDTNSEKPITLRLFLNSPEFTDGYNKFVEEYKKVKPNVTIELQVIQSDYPTILTTKIASGDLPDIFMTTPGAEIKQYAQYSADLSGEPLANAMSESVKANVSYEGKILGAPIASNLFALIYNKDLFKAAGITSFPKTTSELQDAINKLKAKGITPFTSAYKEWWVQKHIFQHFVDAASANPEKLVNDFIAGNTTFKDHPLLLSYFDFIDLTVKEGTPKVLEKDFSAQTAEFATGKAAIMTGQGGWAEDAVTKINPKINIGIMGYPVSNDANNSQIILGSGAVLRINKSSKVLQEAKDFVNWLYTSDYGQNWFSDFAKAIPPITDGKYPNVQMVNDMQEILKTEKPADEAIAYSLNSFHQKFGEIIQAYIGGQINRDQAIDQIQQVWMKLGAVK
ncbi:putative binding protein MsmE [Paenibacillus baekrokdamisoli]|uniref:Putative binding protein MsmE n=1 Tax=Paenibacillus baekrokdamisoli TaxID=1712516 RepID=A0A3G9J0K1_9BACL|nr:extracellular solute-binding protein [Paenibacillus baekrokdamisoli]MBB3067403.1 raffinose/stachyose/melibiose transport system substrate-binding protein [Paenibacillus baekrokdamisoli]BBH19411.1 putative binding protein MsmE [Paenibacillus baekrokdamisoli]